jgi:hypothetical protein
MRRTPQRRRDPPHSPARATRSPSHEKRPVRAGARRRTSCSRCSEFIRPWRLGSPPRSRRSATPGLVTAAAPKLISWFRLDPSAREGWCAGRFSAPGPRDDTGLAPADADAAPTARHGAVAALYPRTHPPPRFPHPVATARLGPRPASSRQRRKSSGIRTRRRGRWSAEGCENESYTDSYGFRAAARADGSRTVRLAVPHGPQPGKGAQPCARKGTR